MFIFQKGKASSLLYNLNESSLKQFIHSEAKVYSYTVHSVMIYKQGIIAQLFPSKSAKYLKAKFCKMDKINYLKS